MILWSLLLFATVHIGSSEPGTLRTSVRNEEKPAPPTENTDTLIQALDGYYVIGGLFRVHSFKKACNKSIAASVAVQHMEAFRYRIKQFNKMGILPDGKTLGYRIHDTCPLPVSDAMHDMGLTYMCDEIKTKDIRKGTVMAIAGPFSSYVYNGIHSFSFDCVPMVSSLASASQFENEVNHPYFFRTIPADLYQSVALVDIAVKLGYPRGILVYEDTVYAKGMKEDLVRADSRNSNFMFSKTIKVLRIPKGIDRIWTKAFPEILETAEKQGAYAVFLSFGYTAAGDYFKQLKSIYDSNPLFARLRYFGADAWNGHEQIPKNRFTSGSVGTQLWNEPMPEIDHHLKSLTIRTTDNVMLKRLIAQERGCSLYNDESNLNHCSGNETLKTLNTANVHLTVASVDLIAHALSKALKRERFAGSTFKSILKKTVVNDSVVNFRFYDGTNGGEPHYSITELKDFGNGTYEWIKIGEFERTVSKISNATKRNEWPIECAHESYDKNEYWKCYHFYSPKDPESILFSVVGIMGLISTLILFIISREAHQSKVQPMWTSNMPFVDPLLILSVCFLYISSLLTWIPNQGACVGQKALVSSLWAVGSTSLAMKAQGTRRARAGIFECLGLFTRNIQAAVLAQLLIIFLMHILLLAIWFSLNTDTDHGDFEVRQPHFARICSLFGPNWITLFIYAISTASSGVSIFYSISLLNSSEPYLKKEGFWLIIGAIGFSISLIFSGCLSFAGFYFKSVRLFSSTNFLSCLLSATFLLIGQGSFKDLEISRKKSRAEKMEYFETKNRYELSWMKSKVQEPQDKSPGPASPIVKAYSSDYEYPRDDDQVAVEAKPYSSIGESQNPYSEMPAKSNCDQESTSGYSSSEVKSEISSAYSERTQDTGNLALFMENLPERQKLTLKMLSNSGFLGKHGALVIESPSGEEELRLTRRDLETLVEAKEEDFPADSGTYASIQSPDPYDQDL